ncbi:Hypothetical protein SMAX5B_012997 [Scophthalmus maximus]|uniref:Peptidase S1 domain-containing protein n=1 Tax=Scophthalmus maximus TaxID=52904 RepID=A0A2U9BMC9_SCOMX|nr:Hypothetical protein SMAX5B_012997 [Scophthalmus maximus]
MTRLRLLLVSAWLSVTVSTGMDVQKRIVGDFKLVDCKSLIQRLKADIPERYSRRSHQHWFCAKTDLVDGCFGDSGGGAVFEDKIYGVVSFTGDPKYVCREDIGIMDLCNQDYRKWIDDTIKT